MNRNLVRFRTMSLLILTLLFCSQTAFTQVADAGPDKYICASGAGVVIGGGAENASLCYYWEPAEGLSNQHILHPTANPAATTTYTLTVVGQNFSSKSTDNVIVNVIPAADCCSANAVVAPTSNPTTTSPAVDNSCLPNHPTIIWTACFDEAGQKWYVRVNSVECTGQININPWPSLPTTMTVPNTANPVVGGNINNVVGSLNRWSYANSDMGDYDVAGGGAGPHWHSTAASTAHEYYHWNIDWMTSCINAFWPAAETDLENLNVSVTTANTKAAAITALTAQVNTRFNQYKISIVNNWNNVIAPADVPGGGGGGYAAGMAILNGLIASVTAFKVAQGW
jgi:hypothetical protein